jgi:hypothetical protein
MVLPTSGMFTLTALDLPPLRRADRVIHCPTSPLSAAAGRAPLAWSRSYAALTPLPQHEARPAAQPHAQLCHVGGVVRSLAATEQMPSLPPTWVRCYTPSLAHTQTPPRPSPIRNHAA